MTDSWLLILIPIGIVLAIWAAMQFLVGSKRVSIGVLLTLVVAYALVALVLCGVLFGVPLLTQTDRASAELTEPSFSGGIVVTFLVLAAAAPGIATALLLLAGYWVKAKLRRRTGRSAA